MTEHPTEHPGTSRVARLAIAAGEAAEVRTLTTHPDVIALRVERVRSQVDALIWVGIALGLAFTMVNVQAFAAGNAPAGSLSWWSAWLLDPMVSLVLVAVLRAEQVTARYRVPTRGWARRTKWFTFAATYTMNTWTSWGVADGTLSPAGIVLHSIPPMLVFFAAEAGPFLRDKLTEAVRAAATEQQARLPEPEPAPDPVEDIATARPPVGPDVPLGALTAGTSARVTTVVAAGPAERPAGWPAGREETDPGRDTGGPARPEADRTTEAAAGPARTAGSASAAAGPQDRPGQRPGLTNDEIADDIRIWLADPHRPQPTRNAVKRLYGIGSGRADRVMTDAGCPVAARTHGAPGPALSNTHDLTHRTPEKVIT